MHYLRKNKMNGFIGSCWASARTSGLLHSRPPPCFCRALHGTSVIEVIYRGCIGHLSGIYRKNSNDEAGMRQ